MFVAGAGVRGGFHARWPGLANSYEADLTVTTDYRQVLADIVVEAVQRLGGEGVPRAEVAAHGRHALTRGSHPDLPGTCRPRR